MKGGISLSIATVTTHVEAYNRLVHNSGSQKSKMGPQLWVPSGGSRGEATALLFQLLEAVCTPWPVDRVTVTSASTGTADSDSPACFMSAKSIWGHVKMGIRMWTWWGWASLFSLPCRVRKPFKGQVW